MPHHKSCIKRLRQSEENRIRNHAQKTALRRILKQARASLDAGETIDLKAIYSRIDKVGSKGMIHKSKAARLKSRLAKIAAKRAAAD